MNHVRASKWTVLVALGMVVGLLLSGCGGGVMPPRAKKISRGEEKKTEDASGGAGEAMTQGSDSFPEDKATCSLKGLIKLGGKTPKMLKVDISPDPKCAAKQPEGGLFLETIVVSETGELANVIVYVTKGVEKYRFDPPSKPIEVDQVGCRYIPHAFGMMAGQKLLIKNADPTLHNVKADLDGAPLFNIAQTPDKEDEKSVDDQGVLKMVCNVHPWMSAFARVLPHPFHATSDKKGEFAFERKLPPGAYTLTTWHEKLKPTTLEVELKDGESKSVEITLSAK
ncbi:MAG: carboxypeptidase regulatory-like domain-containing protein [Planctomycetota bacterium]|nr:carboxypeptidase regulatory-like domain-containing protein [Planctomycetota bacterium]